MAINIGEYEQRMKQWEQQRKIREQRIIEEKRIREEQRKRAIEEKQKQNEIRELQREIRRIERIFEKQEKSLTKYWQNKSDRYKFAIFMDPTLILTQFYKTITTTPKIFQPCTLLSVQSQEKLKSGKSCKEILSIHREILKDDPERLTTDFICKLSTTQDRRLNILKRRMEYQRFNPTKIDSETFG